MHFKYLRLDHKLNRLIHCLAVVLVLNFEKILASLNATKHRSQSCFHVLNKLILLDHADLILVQECINVGTFFDESGAEIGTFL